jgi:hypothetical protein
MRLFAYSCPKKMKTAIASHRRIGIDWGQQCFLCVRRVSKLKEGNMLSLRFSRDDYAFVYSAGRPIGAILVGETSGRSQFSLLFSGREFDFEVLRPAAVVRRFGREELAKLQSQFLRPSPKGSMPGDRGAESIKTGSVSEEMT